MTSVQFHIQAGVPGRNCDKRRHASVPAKEDIYGRGRLPTKVHWMRHKSMSHKTGGAGTSGAFQLSMWPISDSPNIRRAIQHRSNLRYPAADFGPCLSSPASLAPSHVTPSRDLRKSRHCLFSTRCSPVCRAGRDLEEKKKIVR